MTKEELITQIRNAFADTKYPRDDIGYSPTDWEAQELEKAFKGHTWQNLPRELLIKHRGDGTFFKAKAFAYYLPAFMIFILEDQEEADVMVDGVVHHFTLPQDNSDPKQLAYLNERFEKLTKEFSDEQKKVIAQFLQYLLVRYSQDYPINGPKPALERYWGKYLNTQD